MGISSQGGGQLDDLLGSFTQTSTVGTECSNNWYLYKRWLQLVVHSKPHSSRIGCMSNWRGHDHSPGKPASQVVLFSFSSENTHKLTESPSFVIFASHAPAAVSSHCLWLASTIVHCWWLAKCNIGCWASQIPPTPPTEKPRLYCSGLLLHQQRNSTLWHHRSYSITLTALSIIVNAM